jgi:sporulation-control protein spo0M
MVALAGILLAHAPPDAGIVIAIVPPGQTDNAPLMAGKGDVTVTVTVRIQPAEEIQLIVVVPTDTPVTVPVVLVVVATVAMDGLVCDQLIGAGPEDKIVVLP